MNEANARVWHPWLRINRVLRVMLHTRWSAEDWQKIKAEFKKALALKSQIRRAGWFIHENASGSRRRQVDSQRRRVPVRLFTLLLARIQPSGTYTP